MSDNWQTPLALLVVLAALAGLARAVWKRRRAPGQGCGGGCGCATDALKDKLKK